MRASTLDVLACPSCRRSYAAVAHLREGDEILSGHLRCDGCGVVIPVVEGFPLFGEPRLHAGLASPQAIAALAARLFGTDDDYRRYIALKAGRATQEDYAAYGPFNEATRSAEPLHRVLDTHLSPGDFILDTWCRTGWSGEALASRFPDQHVIAIWEGDSSVLGYRGFRYWLNHRRRAANLDIVFTYPEKPLPFRDGAFAGLQGQDALHRYALHPFAAECLRVTKREGALLFPHVHLTNSEPDPWFDRGCRQDHGLDYRAWLDAVLEGDGRQGYVMSEPHLFAQRGGAPVADTPLTTDYNGAVMIADAARGASPLTPGSLAAGLEPGMRLLLNPLFRISLQRMTARIDDGWRGGGVGHYLDRHPLYRRHLPQAPVALTGDQLMLIALAVVGRTVEEIGTAFEVSAAEAAERLAPLVALDLILPAPVSAAALELQRFHANQLAPAAPLSALLAALAASDAPQIGAPDGSGSTGAEVRQTIDLLAGVLAAEGLRPGDHLAISEIKGAFGLLLLLAGASLGLNTTVSPGRWEGSPPALLAHADDRPHENHPSALPLGLAGDRARSILALATEATPVMLTGPPPPAEVRLSGGAGMICCSAADLFEAAYALRGCADVDFAAVNDVASPEGLLTCLISLATERTIHFEADV